VIAYFERTEQAELHATPVVNPDPTTAETVAVSDLRAICEAPPARSAHNIQGKP
jgi:hypothetical protein